jgi:hypothetical protein
MDVTFQAAFYNLANKLIFCSTFATNVHCMYQVQFQVHLVYCKAWTKNLLSYCMGGSRPINVELHFRLNIQVCTYLCTSLAASWHPHPHPPHTLTQPRKTATHRQIVDKQERKTKHWNRRILDKYATRFTLDCVMHANC